MIITNDRINETVFFKDNYRNLRYKNGEKSNVLMPGDFVKVNTLQLSFTAGDGDITGIGFLENMASEAEISAFYKEEYNNLDEFIDYEEFIKRKQESKVEALQNDENTE